MVLLNYSKSLFKQATKDYEKLQAFYHQLLYFSIMAFGKKKKKISFTIANKISHFYTKLLNTKLFGVVS